MSLGGVETILSHPATMSHAALPEEVRQERGITFGLFRLSVGLEDPDEPHCRHQIRIKGGIQ